MPGTSPESPWDPGDPLGTRLGHPGTLLGPQGTHLGPLGTPLGRPGTPQGRPWDLQGPLMTPCGPQKRSYLNNYTAPEALDCCVRSCL